MVKETELLAHLLDSITYISISEEREKGRVHGKILLVDCSATALPNDLFSFNNFLYQSALLHIYSNSFNTVAVIYSFA